MKLNLKIEIPKGWRKLKTGTRLKLGDRFAHDSWGTWELALWQGSLVTHTDGTFIRRKRKG